METKQLLQPGDRAPNFFLPDQRELVISLYDKVKGGPILAVFLANADADMDVAVLNDLVAREPALADGGVHVFCVIGCDEAAMRARAIDSRAAFFVVADVDGKVAGRFGVADGIRAAFILDPNQRVTASRALTAPEDFAGIAAQAQGLPATVPFAGPIHPPILIIPNVLDRKTCQYLIAQYWARGNEDSGTYRVIDGEPVLQTNYNAKRRRDHHILDEDLKVLLRGVFERRVIPEVKRAFHFQITRNEEFKIVCYDADVGGYFRMHRDNTTPQTLHRRFALTLILNAEDFDGGELTFPEFGGATYTPPTGAAVVFSCDLLHQVADVRRGRRFVILSFMFDDAGAKQKQQFRAALQKRRDAQERLITQASSAPRARGSLLIGTD